MKKILLALTFVSLIVLAFTNDFHQIGHQLKEKYPEFTEANHRDLTRPPNWTLSIPPTNLLQSYYDYMIGGFNSTPLQVQPDPDYGGYFLTFHGKRTSTGQRRVFYSYIGNYGIVENMNELTFVQNWEGYPSVDVDPVSGKPIYAWHANVDADAEYEVQYAYDAYLFGAAGLISDPIVVFNNPSTVIPYNTVDNEFIWPTVKIGPSPTAGMRRVYVLSRNAKTHTVFPSENVKIAFADFNADLLEMGSNLTWTYISIPTLDAWNHDTVSYRRPNCAFTIGNDGRIYYIGYHSASTINPEAPIIEPDLDVFVCDNYGQGTWQRYTASSNLPSWNPPSNFGQGPGIFTNPQGVPYLNNEIYWKIMNSNNINAVTDNNGIIHSIAMWNFTDVDDYFFPEFNTIRELTFNALTHEFSIREVYPIAGNSFDNVYWQPWDQDGDMQVDQYDTATGNPTMAKQWNFPHWDAGLHNNAMMFHYNNYKITKPNDQGWMACVWQNSWRARQFNEYDDLLYAAYADVPEIYISVSIDFGMNWSEPIIVNSVEVAQFAGNRPMWVYPSDVMQTLSPVYGRLALMFYHDNTWGAAVLDQGTTDGGNVKFMAINILMNSNPPQTGITGYVLNSNTNQPISGAIVTTGTVSCSTDTNGYYFMELNAGTYSLTASKPGFASQTVYNIYVEPYAVTNHSFSLPPLPFINVTGIVQSGIPVISIPNATVTLTGYVNYSVTTNALGGFHISNVCPYQIYTCIISKPGYASYSTVINTEGADFSMGTITLQELILAPGSVIANISDGGEVANVLWTAPIIRETPDVKTYETDYSANRDERILMNYHIWRLEQGQETNEQIWEHIATTESNQFVYSDLTWVNLASGFYKYAVKAEYSNTLMSAATISNAVEKFTANDDNTNVAEIDKFLGVYPNPFRNSTQLAFSLKTDCPVRFDIYNVHGHLVSTVFRNNNQKGSNVIDWNATDKSGRALPSGIYFCRMKTDKNCELRKLIHIK